MDKISVFDTSISDSNLGNQIIMDSIYKQLHDIFPFGFFFKLPYMEINKHTLGYIKMSDFVFFGGTNSLTSRMEKYNQWGLSIRNYRDIKNVFLMGMGWWQYQDEKTSLYTKFLLNHVLNKNLLHSVRDSYAEKKLNEIGFNNVVNTGCPTLWGLTTEHCRNIKKNKSKDALVTFTDYNQNLKRDKKIFETLQKNYDVIYAWVQGSGDYDYIKEHFGNSIELIEPNLNSYDEALSSLEIDYIGTRLHAGIRALQHQKRTIIISIDNRAVEMGQDFNLPVIGGDKINNLNEMINSNFETRINLPLENIKKWKEQFYEK